MIDPIRLVKTFVELAQINSESFKEGKLATFIVNKMASMGIDVRVDISLEQIKSDTGNLIIRFPGNKSVPRILFMAHMDTVSPGKGIQVMVENDVIQSVGDTILGADDKAGIAAIIELVEVLNYERIEHGDIMAILTVAEEKGSIGAKNIDYKNLKTDYAFVLDGEGPVGGIITQTPTQNIIKAKFIGKSAHSGISPEIGINAIQAASNAISRMKLGRLDEETTANIGVIRGGTSFNVVASETYVEGEVRSFSMEKLKTQTEHIMDCLTESAKDIGAEVKINTVRGFTGYNLKPDNKAIAIASEAIKKAGLTPKLVTTGGGSDANVLNEKGIDAVNLATGMVNPHSKDESITVKELESLTKVLLEIVKIALQNKI
ncbi:M20/M25/M40 family metallo-hydrolase [Candidatus Oleimmundimicrobium sp.]|uniref:M20/M25/M40 family metallo-hydrolase n=1 Tax=Candidatus Oleimmundimicrobium sp. TaxID=3060597 RepID=UPI00280ADDCD|nr:M20/M25/M40 family metallo-hydrolase [Candidatus Oleimmundimicrobium sp.]